ncbi:MAG: membrane protein insertase YidC [Legionellaceae bacterium]|nr:membrane protein insertase YidC [Legionellaceae bacterium]
MDNYKTFLYAAFFLVLFSLWFNWEQEHPVAQKPVAAVSSSPSTLLPSIKPQEGVLPENKITPSAASVPHIEVKVNTDVLNVSIDTKNGNIVQALLLQYPVALNEENQKVQLLFDNEKQRYIAASDLLIPYEDAVLPLEVSYEADHPQYTLAENQTTLTVHLQGQTAQGLKVIKTFTFHKGSYLIDVAYTVKNLSINPKTVYFNMQLLRKNPGEDKSSLFHVGSYTGASYSDPGKSRYKKISFEKMQDLDLKLESSGGWIAMQQHYFVSAWVPQVKTEYTLYTRASDGTYTIGAVSNPLLINPNTTRTISSQVYIGPEVASILKTVSPGLDLTIDYGMLWFISSLLFSCMKFIYSYVGNWGFSIILVTIFVKLLFFKLSASSYRSMANMKKLQPKLLALRERYGDDKVKISQATMELYRSEKVNPFGGCLPVVVQIPVFIALYWVLLESVELRQAPFILWIKDLSAADPYHVLPVLMGLSMLIQQRLNPAPMEAAQARMMMLLPVLFTAIFWGFPAGLVLYWIVNNTLSILQQWYITKKYAAL